MDQHTLKNEWIEMSTAWIKETREGRNPNREGLLDEPMLKLCGDVTKLKILDSGCGEGRFSRILSQKGAQYVLGIDLCEPMINAANELPAEGIEYRLGDVQDMAYLEDGSFDLVVSYLNHCDLPDFIKNSKEVYRVLKKHGRFIIANLHPMRSAVGAWKKNDQGEKEYVILDNYLQEGERHWKIMGIDITNFHRTLSTYVNSFIELGFTLRRIEEPTVSPEKLEKYPELEDELRVPNFIIYELLKA